MTDTQTLLKHINLYNLTKEQYESMLENGEIDSNAFYYLRDDTSLIDIKTNSDNILNLQNIINAKTSSVISGSSNLMTSGGVYSALGASTLSSGILNLRPNYITGISTSTTGTGTLASGYIYLRYNSSWKVLIQWGQHTRSTATDTVTFPIAYNSSVVPQVFIQAHHTANSTDGRPPLVNTITYTNFVLNSYTGYNNFSWWAIGGK
ncbi:hypothetical protein IJ674_09500 [bacterium]|nr:hypothetical protein [bacterium]